MIAGYPDGLHDGSPQGDQAVFADGAANGGAIAASLMLVEHPGTSTDAASGGKVGGSKVYGTDKFACMFVKSSKV